MRSQQPRQQVRRCAGDRPVHHREIELVDHQGFGRQTLAVARRQSLGEIVLASALPRGARRSRRRTTCIQSAMFGAAMFRHRTFSRSCQLLSTSSSTLSKLATVEPEDLHVVARLRPHDMGETCARYGIRNAVGSSRRRAVARLMRSAPSYGPALATRSGRSNGSGVSSRPSRTGCYRCATSRVFAHINSKSKYRASRAHSSMHTPWIGGRSARQGGSWSAGTPPS